MTTEAAWHPTACILCSRNCGLEVKLEGRRLAAIKGDARHPVSRGYLCQKAVRLDHYQNHADRLSSPLRRRADGTFEPVSWETAIGEIAARVKAIRADHGPRAFAYYGGGGQGNHLGGVFGSGFVRALGTRYHYSALAQEKTGDFWVNGRLFGRQTCHTTEDVENAEVVVFIGTNPWQAHGIRNAREVLKAIAADPEKTMIVVDPRRTETAALAKVHLQVRPGTDAFLLAAILGTIVQEGLVDRAFLSARTSGFEALRVELAAIPVAAHAARAGLDEARVREVARTIARARSASVRVDLGLQQSPHSTLNSYLEKLLFLLTGHFGREGCNAFHTFFLPLIGHSDPARAWQTTVTGMAEIGKLFPPNVLPAEIDSDHPGRLRALFVDSANPMMSGADTRAYRAAFEKLELLVVVDVALTETARLAHYVLPASSQLEKWEATFFNLEFPTNAFHLRRPILEPTPGTLPEPEIYRRLLVALGELPARFPWLERIARLDRRAPRLGLFAKALVATLALRPKLRPYAAFVLHETLGAALPDGARAAAPLWGAALEYARRHEAAVARAGVADEGAGLGEALFRRILEGRSGTLLSTHRHEDTFGFVRHDDGKIHLEIPEMLEALRALASEPVSRDDAFPLVLTAGERRAYNANTIFRDPGWRRDDPEGALKVNPADALRLGLVAGARASCESKRGSIAVRVAVTDSVPEGLVTLPHGFGLEHPGADGTRRATGPALNELTSAADRDPITATPFHKLVRVRLRALPEAAR
jgi:anaerobic selenocysteine-containing dehydrogenase